MPRAEDAAPHIAPDVTPAELAACREAAPRRREALAARVAARRTRAWVVAREAAALLRGEFDARRVAAFGSLVRPERFHERSDVDLAVWGLPEGLHYRAVGRLLGLDPAIPVDVVRAEDAPPRLLAAIQEEEVEL